MHRPVTGNEGSKGRSLKGGGRMGMGHTLRDHGWFHAIACVEEESLYPSTGFRERRRRC